MSQGRFQKLLIPYMKSTMLLLLFSHALLLHGSAF